MRRHPLAFLTLLLSPACLLAEAVVTLVIGNPRIQSAERLRNAEKGAAVQNGDVILTGPGELLILKLADGGDLVVSEKSRVTFKVEEDASAAKAIDLDLPHGFLWARSPKLKKDASFNVHVPTATAGIRGTSFSASSGEGGAQVCVCEGQVKVTNKTTGLETLLKQGELLRRKDQADASPPLKDKKFLKRPTPRTRNCLDCHQGGHSRDGRY